MTFMKIYQKCVFVVLEIPFIDGRPNNYFKCLPDVGDTHVLSEFPLYAKAYLTNPILHWL